MSFKGNLTPETKFQDFSKLFLNSKIILDLPEGVSFLQEWYQILPEKCQFLPESVTLESQSNVTLRCDSFPAICDPDNSFWQTNDVHKCLIFLVFLTL